MTNASAVLSLVESSISNVNSAVANLGAQSDQIIAHTSFVGKLADSLTVGVGNLVDADIPAESARLTRVTGPAAAWRPVPVDRQSGAVGPAVAVQRAKRPAD